MAQGTLEWSRAELMRGYGPGADPAKVRRWTRDRPDVAGRSVVKLREAVARQAAASRGDRADSEGVLDLEAGPPEEAEPAPRRPVGSPAGMFVLGLFLGGFLGHRQRHRR